MPGATTGIASLSSLTDYLVCSFGLGAEQGLGLVGRFGTLEYWFRLDYYLASN